MLQYHKNYIYNTRKILFSESLTVLNSVNVPGRQFIIHFNRDITKKHCNIVQMNFIFNCITSVTCLTETFVGRFLLWEADSTPVGLTPPEYDSHRSASQASFCHAQIIILVNRWRCGNVSTQFSRGLKDLLASNWKLLIWPYYSNECSQQLLFKYFPKNDNI